MQHFLRQLVTFYQKHISPRKGYQCACHTHNREISCSDHALHVLETYPLLTALHLIWQRKHHCHTVSKQHGFTLKSMYLRHGFAVAGMVALTGCGGGGGGGGGGGTPTPPTPTTLTGNFVITNQGTETGAGGVSYTITSAAPQAAATTANIAAQSSGVTGTGGSFSYNAGDSISFSIGGQTFSVLAATKISAQELAIAFAAAQPQASFCDTACQGIVKRNIELFLLSGDDNHDAALDGINLSASFTVQNIPGSTIRDDTFADLLASALAKKGVPPVSTFKPLLGMNTEAPQAEQDSIAQAVPFVDIFRVARPFKELSSCTSGSISYDSNGWPTSAPSTCTVRTILVNNASANNIPAGTYTVIYDGKGTLEYGNDANFVNGSHTQGLEKININFTGTAINLTIKTTDVNDPIRNIRIVMPGGICEGNPFVRVADASGCPSSPYRDFAETLKTNSDPTKGRNAIVFNPDYLRFMKDFRVIRMMNFMEASPSKTACNGLTSNDYTNCLLQDFTWDRRAKIDAATWGGSARTPLLERYGRGVPLEVAVELANQLNSHPWFNIPHNATDDYVTNFATYVSGHLKSGLKAYIEYSNETWNDTFWAALYVREKGKGLYTPSSNPFWDGAYYTAKRSAEIFQICENTFNGADRLVRILGTYQANKDLSNGMLKYLKDNGNLGHVDALAMGAYFYGCWSRSSNSKCDAANVPKLLSDAASLDDIFSIIDNPKDPYGMTSLQTEFSQQITVANSFGKLLYAYEGGQHLSVDANTDATRRALFILANQDSRMGDRYMTLLNAWKTAGGQQFMLYTQPQSFHTWGLFGIKESLLQPRSSAKKYDAIMTFQETQGKCWWNGC
jgi:putative component of membrane protein insertase Oxa1/YidC/SpoIIIJ protein YidD